jgi:opacity protein-like surface antigen
MRRIMLKRSIAIALVPLALSTTALAASDTGTYIGISAGQAQMLGNGLSNDAGNALGVFLGHDFAHWEGITWGAEGAYNTLGNFSGMGFNGHATEADISLIGTYYLDPAKKLGVYGKVGYDHTWVSVAGNNNSEDGATYGVGLRYFITPKVETRFGYQYYAVGGSNVLSNHDSAWNMGAAYHF